MVCWPKLACLTFDSVVGVRGGDAVFVSGARPRMSRRHSMENLELVKLTPDKMNVRTALLSVFRPHIK